MWLAGSPEKTGPGTEVFFMTEDHFNRLPQAAPPAGLRHIVFSPSADSFTSTFSDQGSDPDEDFCIIDDPGMGIAVSPCYRFSSAESDVAGRWRERDFYILYLCLQ